MWLSAPLHLVLLAVLGVDAWAAQFWVRVGGQLGLVIGGAAVLVGLALAALIGTDLRRQWLLGRGEE